MTRRKFLATTTAATALTPLAIVKARIQGHAGFALAHRFAPTGASTGVGMPFVKSKAAGHDGGKLATREKGSPSFSGGSRQKHGLSFGFSLRSGNSVYGKHFAEFEKC
ncbi:MAG: hypothetical protein IPM82_22080 [Saprospiraceae bacterium]|nr:hypothetical protein [Saprospiraceae bacterium]